MADLSRYSEADHGYNTLCWDWAGAPSRKGYGTTQVDGIKKNAHRAVYEAENGKLPRDLHLDHLCRNKLCVRPSHMEPVTPLENERRKRAALALVVRMIELEDAA
nr:HNH endonuclease signature motif containing protein [Methylobacterium sp. BTF04]